MNAPVFDYTVPHYEDDIVFSPIPQHGRHLEIVMQGRGTYSGAYLLIGLLFNGDADINYHWQAIRGLGGSGDGATPNPLVAQGGQFGIEHRAVCAYLPGGPLTGPDTAYRGHSRIVIPNYTDPGSLKGFSWSGGAIWGIGIDKAVHGTGSGWWRQQYAGPITRIRLLPDVGQFFPGTSVQAYIID